MPELVPNFVLNMIKKFIYISAVGDFVISTWLKTWLTVALLVVLSACSSVAVVPTYDEGAVAIDQRAFLHAPGDITVVSVNGRSMKRYLLDDLPIDYALAPGPQDVVFKYKSIWAKPGVTGDDKYKVDVVESGEQRVVFDVRGTTHYQFEMMRPENRAEAERFVKKPTIRIVDASGGTVARAENYVAPVALAAGAAAATTVGATTSGAAAPVPGATTAPVSRGLPTIDALKVLWEQATTEEKRDFLRWAFK